MEQALATLFTALVAGSAAALQSTVGEAVKDGYAALKKMIKERYGGVELAPVESDPADPAGREELAQQLRESGAGADAEMLAKAQALLEQIATSAPDVADIIGVDIKGVRAGKVLIEDVVSAGAGIRAQDVVAKGDFVISGIRAGNGSAAGKR